MSKLKRRTLTVMESPRRPVSPTVAEKMPIVKSGGQDTEESPWIDLSPETSDSETGRVAFTARFSPLPARACFDQTPETVMYELKGATLPIEKTSGGNSFSNTTVAAAQVKGLVVPLQIDLEEQVLQTCLRTAIGNDDESAMITLQGITNTPGDLMASKEIIQRLASDTEIEVEVEVEIETERKADINEEKESTDKASTLSVSTAGLSNHDTLLSEHEDGSSPSKSLKHLMWNRDPSSSATGCGHETAGGVNVTSHVTFESVSANAILEKDRDIHLESDEVLDLSDLPPSASSVPECEHLGPSALHTISHSPTVDLQPRNLTSLGTRTCDPEDGVHVQIISREAREITESVGSNPNHETSDTSTDDECQLPRHHLAGSKLRGVVAGAFLNDEEGLIEHTEIPLVNDDTPRDEMIAIASDTLSESNSSHDIAAGDVSAAPTEDANPTDHLEQLQPLDEPTKGFRSGTRFSDDRNMLKDFLDREKARKAAKDPPSSVSAPMPMACPRRSPRKALGEMDKNFPSPQKARDLASRPGTPPGKASLGAPEMDHVDELSPEPSSYRRSTRRQLFTPAKLPSGGPSFIPVRRPDGADSIVLARSVAQELALVTRANTRRNKGQSKPPKITLQNLPVETLDSVAVAPHEPERTKSVDWDATLVYYQGGSDDEAKAGNEAKRPELRRSGKLRAMKAVAEADGSHWVPAPKRRSRNRRVL